MAQDILHRRHTIPVPRSTRRRQAKSVASYLDEKPPREAGMGARGRAQPRFDKEEARLRHFRTVAKAPTRPALTLPAMRPHEDDEAQKRHAVKDILEHSDPELLLHMRALVGDETWFQAIAAMQAEHGPHITEVRRTATPTHTPHGADGMFQCPPEKPALIPCGVSAGNARERDAAAQLATPAPIEADGE